MGYSLRNMVFSEKYLAQDFELWHRQPEKAETACTSAQSLPAC